MELSEKDTVTYHADNNTDGEHDIEKSRSPTPVLSRSASSPMLSSSSNLTTPLTTISESSPVESLFDFYQSHTPGLYPPPRTALSSAESSHSDSDDSAYSQATTAYSSAPSPRVPSRRSPASPSSPTPSTADRASARSRSSTSTFGRHFDNEVRSLRSSLSNGSLRSLFRARQSPRPSISEPPLTPLDTLFPAVPATPLSAIEERKRFLEQQQRARESTPPPPPNLKMRKILPSPIVVVQPDVFVHSPHSQRSPPFSPSSFLSDSPLNTSISSTFSLPSSISPLNTMKRSEVASPNASLFDRSSIFSSGTLKAEKEALKARAKAEKLEKKAREKAERDISKKEAQSMSQDRKAAKSEEKKRKKEEERQRIERLAATLKYRRQADARSTTSSAIRREQASANKWIENSDGMYGGLGTWGSL